MSAAYWDQWDRAEIISMHGADIEDEDDTDSCQEEDDTDSCHDMMYDLGLSWRDFM